MTWSAANALDVWEHGYSLGPMNRALVLLKSTTPDPPGGWLALKPGEVMQRLLNKYESEFGTRLEATASCPVCGTEVEMTFTVHQVRQAIPAGKEIQAKPLHLISVEDLEIVARDLNVGDLHAASACSHAGEAHRMLFQRSVISASKAGTEVSAAELPEKTRKAVSQRLEEADPWGDPRVSLTCPDCKNTWDSGVDAGAHLWIELDASVRILQREVVALARGLGWSESEILEMSPSRRRLYLDLLRENTSRNAQSELGS